MSTKEQPGDYDCYQKLAPDEPYFVLRAKDPNAPALVELWAALREAQYGHYPKLAEARRCAMDMKVWKKEHPEAKPSVPEPHQVTEHQSGQPCGCDPGIGYLCQRHRDEAERV